MFHVFDTIFSFIHISGIDLHHTQILQEYQHYFQDHLSRDQLRHQYLNINNISKFTQANFKNTVIKWSTDTTIPIHNARLNLHIDTDTRPMIHTDTDTAQTSIPIPIPIPILVSVLVWYRYRYPVFSQIIYLVSVPYRYRY